MLSSADRRVSVGSCLRVLTIPKVEVRAGNYSFSGSSKNIIKHRGGGRKEKQRQEWEKKKQQLERNSCRLVHYFELNIFSRRHPTAHAAISCSVLVPFAIPYPGPNYRGRFEKNIQQEVWSSRCVVKGWLHRVLVMTQKTFSKIHQKLLMLPRLMLSK